MDLHSALESDEIDQLNDETFGADVVGGNDWEEEHEKLAVENEIHKLEIETDGLLLSDLGDPGNNVPGSDLENSIDRLMKDEEDDEIDDPAIVTLKRAIPVPSAVKSHREVLQTSSPPPFADTLDNLLHPDADIWGSPAKHSPMDRNILDLLKPTDTGGGRFQENWDASIASTPKTVADMATLEKMTRPGSAVSTGRPFVSSPQQMQSSYRTVGNGGLIGAGDWLGPPPGFPAVPNLHAPPPLMMRPPATMPTPLLHPMLRFSDVGPPFRAPTLNVTQPPPPIGMYQPSRSEWQQRQQQQQRFLQHAGAAVPGPHIQGQLFHPASVHNHSAMAAMRRPQQPTSYGYFPRVTVPVGPQIIHHVRPSVQQNVNLHVPSLTNSTSGGGYITDGCIMTRNEKEWIIKIQMQQLHTEDPFLDDYYYTMIKLKKHDQQFRNQPVGAGGGGGDGPRQLIVPAIAKLETKEYKPVQFENTLGKLAVSSIHKPKQVLDVSGSAHEDGKPATHRNQRYREALIHIEQCYDAVLKIEELEKKVLSVPDVARIEMLQTREKSIQHLYERMSSPEHLLAYLSIRKGKLLFSRLLPLLTKAKAQWLLCSFFSNLPKILKKDSVDQVLPQLLDSITYVVSQSDMRGLASFAGAMREHLMTLLQDKFLSSVVVAMLVRAEAACMEDDDDADTSKKWREFVNAWVSCRLSGNAAAPLDLQRLAAAQAYVVRFFRDEIGDDSVQELAALRFREA